MSEGGKKEWTTEEICTLIDALREHRNLWYPRDANYKNRIAKVDSHKQIAQLFDTNYLEIARKIKNITSQYLRERRNYKKIKKSGAGQNFIPRWFGYNAMSFMHDKNKPRKGVQIGGEYEESESSDDDPQTETRNSVDIHDLEDEPERSKVENSATPLETDKFCMQNASTSNAPENEFTSKNQPKKKTNRNVEKDNESESTQVFNMMKSVYEKKERDEYDVFGEMVANNIRSLKTEYSRITVQQQITNILFDARRSHLPQSSCTPMPSPSTPSWAVISDNSSASAMSGQKVQVITLSETNDFNPIQGETSILKEAFSSLFQDIN
uniref:Uncharacterized protein LOC114325862 n=1 Tax=Diabrotica virgifera virgifera TaxID=50390 RepID=A0A6P7GSR3_DIAVI